jgi:hypothetical protein
MNCAKVLRTNIIDRCDEEASAIVVVTEFDFASRSLLLLLFTDEVFFATNSRAHSLNLIKDNELLSPVNSSTFIRPGMLGILIMSFLRV